MQSKTWNRRDFLKWSAAATGALTAAPWAMRPREALPAAKSLPNILFFCTDQQRVDDMSCFGNHYVKTPGADALAVRGVRFTRSYCAFPLCSPSRATHLTSRMAHEVGVNTNGRPLPADIPSLGPLFKEAGYRTAFTGKWHLPNTWPTPDSDEVRGFEVLARKTADGAAGAGKNFRKGRQAETGAEDEDSSAGGPGSANDPLSMSAAIEFIKEDHQQPFLLFVSYLNPHDICGFHETSPQTLHLPIDPSVLPPAPTNLDAPDLGPPKGSGQAPVSAKKQNSELHWSELTWRQQLYHYYDLTAEVDGLIAKVLEALRVAGLDKNTLILYTADHGEMAGSHRRIRKMSLYEEAMKVPFIVAGPGIPSGVTDDTHLVSGLDVLPTLLDFAGIAPPSDARGMSVKPLLDNPKAPWREAVFAALSETAGRMVRTEKHKYNVYNGNVEELFDLEADPGEKKSLVEDPSKAQVLEQHRKLLHDWMEKTKDPFSHPELVKGLRPVSKEAGAAKGGGKAKGDGAEKGAVTGKGGGKAKQAGGVKAKEDGAKAKAALSTE